MQQFMSVTNIFIDCLMVFEENKDEIHTFIAFHLDKLNNIYLCFAFHTTTKLNECKSL